VILSGVMMFRYFGWNEAADLIEAALERAIAAGQVTFDLARPMLDEGRAQVREVGTAAFATAIIQGMK
jgi:isocitrate dehydrogenase